MYTKLQLDHDMCVGIDNVYVYAHVFFYLLWCMSPMLKVKHMYPIYSYSPKVNSIVLYYTV